MLQEHTDNFLPLSVQGLSVILNLLSDQEKVAHTWVGHGQKKKDSLCLSKWESDGRYIHSSYSPENVSAHEALSS